VELLRTGTERCETNAVAVIGELAKDVSTRAAIVAVGALPPLAELLRTGTERCKTNAVAAIGELAKDARTCALIVAAGALPPFAEVLHADTEDAKASVASLLVGLATEMQLEISALQTERDALAEGFESLV